MVMPWVGLTIVFVGGWLSGMLPFYCGETPIYYAEDDGGARRAAETWF